MLVLMPACISDLDLNVPEGDDQIIVEGWIEQGGYAHVLVSHTKPYNSTAGLADLLDLIVTDAQVTVKCGDAAEKLLLVEDTMYAIVPVYRGFSIRGEPGRIYTLEVKVGDRLFTSTDTLPGPIGPDSVWFLPETAGDSLGFIHIRLEDPPRQGNYYRFFAKRLGIDLDYNGLSGALLDDHFFNGETIHFMLVRTGPTNTGADKYFFRKGQRVVVKTCTVTHGYYKFLSSVTNELGSTLSPLNFQAPATTTFTGGALGGWGCYSVSRDTINIR